MKHAVFSAWIALALQSCAATSGGAVHPEPGKPNTAEYCKKGPPEEQNCMACASKPGCGFCGSPVEPAPVCQPGSASETHSSGCNIPLLISNEDCAPAPPP